MNVFLQLYYACRFQLRSSNTVRVYTSTIERNNKAITLCKVYTSNKLLFIVVYHLNQLSYCRRAYDSKLQCWLLQCFLLQVIKERTTIYKYNLT